MSVPIAREASQAALTGSRGRAYARASRSMTGSERGRSQGMNLGTVFEVRDGSRDP